jgi:hypothetical protein
LAETRLTPHLPQENFLLALSNHFWREETPVIFASSLSIAICKASAFTFHSGVVLQAGTGFPSLAFVTTVCFVFVSKLLRRVKERPPVYLLFSCLDLTESQFESCTGRRFAVWDEAEGQLDTSVLYSANGILRRGEEKGEMADRFRALKFGTDLWDPSHRFETSWLLPPWVLFGVRAAIVRSTLCPPNSSLIFEYG